MRSARFWIIATLCASTLPAVVAAMPTLASPAERVAVDETVVVYAANGMQTNIGAGVIVGRRDGALVIATAAHVIAAANVIANGAVRVRLDSGEQLNVAEIDRIGGFDLALLKTASYDGWISSAALGQPSAGEDVYIWGHRLAQSYVESQASITDVDPILPEGPADGRFAIECPTCGHGDSGAGVFDSRGRLLGILEGARRDQNGNIVYVECEPVAPIATLLASGA